MKKSAGLIRPGRKTRRRKCWLALSFFNQSRRMSIDLIGLLRANRRSRKTDSAFVIDKKKGSGLLGVAKVGECERELSQHLPTANEVRADVGIIVRVLKPYQTLGLVYLSRD